MDNKVSPEYLNFDFKKMKKNGYISVKSKIDIDGVKTGDELMTSSNEFGTLEDDAIITCYTSDKREITMQKDNVEVTE